MDYYQVLQIAPNAAPETIKEAYKRLALKYHPDTNHSPDAIERMKQINEAYQVLGDPSARAQYDLAHHYVPKPEMVNQAVALKSTEVATLQTQPAPKTAESKTYCVNHPDTETYLRCNKCGKPVCMKCVQRTPVGYRCNECLGVQRAGYYTATSLDYVLASIIALILGAVGGFVMLLIGGGLGFFGIIIAIFGGPIAGGIISESIRRAVSKRRGRRLAIVACVALAIGAIGVLLAPALPFLMFGRPELFVRAAFNIGFWIFLALALSTTYARLRA